MFDHLVIGDKQGLIGACVLGGYGSASRIDFKGNIAFGGNFLFDRKAGFKAQGLARLVSACIASKRRAGRDYIVPGHKKRPALKPVFLVKRINLCWGQIDAPGKKAAASGCLTRAL